MLAIGHWPLASGSLNRREVLPTHETARSQKPKAKVNKPEERT